MYFRRFAILILLPLAAAGCKRGEDYVVLPQGHPAEPTARTGIALGGPTSLNPELVTVRPSIDEARSQPSATQTPAGQSQQHKH